VKLTRGLNQELAIREGNRVSSGDPGAKRLLREAGLNRSEYAGPEFGSRELHGRHSRVVTVLNWGEATYPRDVEKSIYRSCTVRENPWQKVVLGLTLAQVGEYL